MTVDRLLPTEEAAELVGLVREIARPSWLRARRGRGGRRVPPRRVSAMLGEVGLLGLPYPEEYGGSGQPYEVYLQALEEVAVGLDDRRARASRCT